MSGFPPIGERTKTSCGRTPKPPPGHRRTPPAAWKRSSPVDTQAISPPGVVAVPRVRTLPVRDRPVAPASVGDCGTHPCTQQAPNSRLSHGETAMDDQLGLRRFLAFHGGVVAAVPVSAHGRRDPLAFAHPSIFTGAISTALPECRTNPVSGYSRRLCSVTACRAATSGQKTRPPYVRCRAPSAPGPPPASLAPDHAPHPSAAGGFSRFPSACPL